jgi:hypothetical protein
MSAIKECLSCPTSCAGPQKINEPSPTANSSPTVVSTPTANSSPTVDDVAYYFEQATKAMNKGMNILIDMKKKDNGINNKEGEKCLVTKEIKKLEENKENTLAIRNILQEMNNNVNSRYDLLVSLGNLGQLLTLRNRQKDMMNLEKAIYNYLQ